MYQLDFLDRFELDGKSYQVLMNHGRTREQLEKEWAILPCLCYSTGRVAHLLFNVEVDTDTIEERLCFERFISEYSPYNVKKPSLGFDSSAMRYLNASTQLAWDAWRRARGLNCE